MVDRDVTKVTGGRKNPVRGYWWWWRDCAPRCAGRLPASRAAAPWEGFGDVCAAQTKWGPTSLPTPTIRSCSASRHPAFIPVRFSCDQQPAKRCVAAHAGTIRRRFGRPPFGGRPHLESPSSSLPASAEAVAVQAMDCISCTRSGPYQLVGIATFRDQAIGRFLRKSDPFSSG